MENTLLKEDRLIWDEHRTHPKKRFLGDIGAGISLGGLALGTVNLWDSQTHQTPVKELAKAMVGTVQIGRFLEHGEQVLGRRADVAQNYLHHEIENAWKLVETFRCNTDASVEYALQEIALQRYGEYLRRHTQAAITGAIEGRDTPEIVGAKELKRPLNYEDGSLRLRGSFAVNPKFAHIR